MSTTPLNSDFCIGNYLAVDYNKQTDQELWEHCGSDDKKAYSELFRRYVPKLLKQARGYIKDEMVAEELVMDLMVNLWERRQQPIMTGDVANYFFRAMRNRVLKHLRKSIPETVDIGEIHEDELVETQTADHRTIIADDRTTVGRLLTRLSPKRQEVFRLYVEQDLTSAEIAKKLNISISTVENHIYDSRKELRELMHS